MKNKERNYYICNNCQTEHTRWVGKCTTCDTWNTITQVDSSQIKLIKKDKNFNQNNNFEIIKLSEIKDKDISTTSTGIKDLDQVLGGGVVKASLILLAGEPGVGKSTLSLEITRHTTVKTFYFSGEESVEQVAGRARRMNIINDNLFFSRETNLINISACIRKEKPQIAIIDSIQTVYNPDKAGASGNPGQLREAAIELLETSRSTDTSIFVTGHVTKDGLVAGPRLMEHLVDVVLYFESDRTNHYRILRAVKNRFGAVGEVALFEMVQTGIKPVSSLPLALSRIEIPGAVHSLILGGSRPLPVEVQSLVTKSGSIPRRMTEGLDSKRLVLLSAVLEKYLKYLKLSECDIFANLVGGFSSDEPVLDLAICMAIISSALERPIATHQACLGEIGLAGELRPVERLGIRVKELKSLGFKKVYVPKNNIIDFEVKGIELIALNHVKEILELESLLI